MNELKLKSIYIHYLAQVLKKQLQYFFTTWSSTLRYQKPLRRIATPNLNLTINPDLKSKSNNKTPPKSPIEISNRLFAKAKEIQEKRDFLTKSRTIAFDFTPKLNGSAGRWKQIKTNTLKPKNTQQPLAVVSAQALCSTLQSNFNRSLTPI